MTIKIVKFIKYVCLSAVVIIGAVGCEKEIENIGVDLIDNDIFETNKSTYEVVTTNENVLKVRSTGSSQYLLGVYQDNEFGQLKASIVSQLSISKTGSSYDYGLNAAIDSVIVDIPYQSTKDDEKYSDGRPKFEIDSVIGNRESEFKINIYELKTFLNSLDPNDPSKSAVYYTDKEYQKSSTALYSGNFKVNANDTVALIKRWNSDHTVVYDTDTIKSGTISPSMKFPLDESLIQQLFVDNAEGDEFASFDNFIHYFRGLFIEAEEISPSAHLISLSLASAKMTIYYSNDVETDEGSDEDLNGNGTNGESNVLVRTKEVMNFNLSGIKNNVFSRDYSNAYSSGSDRLYVQGAAGSVATIEIVLGNENLEEIREKNWLVNEANIILYIDSNASSDIIPEQLYLYNYDDNEQIRDVFSEGFIAFGGELERDDDGNPISYKFRITDYISELLKEGSTEELNKFAIKVFNPTDPPTSQTDTKIRDYSWNPKGVVLFDHNAANNEQRVKLVIHYTELNN